MTILFSDFEQKVIAVPSLDGLIEIEYQIGGSGPVIPPFLT